MDVTRFSNTYAVRRLEDPDVPLVYELCRNNPLYYEHCPPFVTEGSIRKDMSALPRDKGPEDKYYVGYFDGDRLIAVMDLIRACPDERTAFIGFFMTDRREQRRGVGSGIIRELCDYLRQEGMAAVRLGWVKGNPQAERFWHKNRFVETGVTSDTGSYTILFAERRLR